MTKRTRKRKDHESVNFWIIIIYNRLSKRTIVRQREKFPIKTANRWRTRSPIRRADSTEFRVRVSQKGSHGMRNTIVVGDWLLFQPHFTFKYLGFLNRAKPVTSLTSSRISSRSFLYVWPPTALKNPRTGFDSRPTRFSHCCTGFRNSQYSSDHSTTSRWSCKKV